MLYWKCPLLMKLSLQYRQITMQIPLSDSDFYQRKISRLEKDIAHLNEQLSVLRSRLRTAEDFQIKYQLLLRQSQQENLRFKKMQEAERAKISELLSLQIQKVNKQWLDKMNNFQEQVRAEEKREKDELLARVEDLTTKNKQMIEKCQQMDVLLFKNKKIAKDLESLEQIIHQNKLNNQRQREDEIRRCKQSLTNKFNQKVAKQKQEYQTAITRLERRNEQLELMLTSAELEIKQKPVRTVPEDSSDKHRLEQLKEEIQKLEKLLNKKDKQLQNLQKQKIEQEDRHYQQTYQLKQYCKDLQQQIYGLQNNHQVELLNLKNRMQEVRREQLGKKQKQYDVAERHERKDVEQLKEKIMKEKEELENMRKIQQAQISKLKQDKEILSSKISDLQNRIQQLEHNQQIGQTQNIIQSLKIIDKKADEVAGYEDGVTFLERQLRKTTIKLEKKNHQVGDLLKKVSSITEDFQKQLQQSKQKYIDEIKRLEEKLDESKDDVKRLNEQVRRKEKQIREQQTQYVKRLNVINTENRALVNMNNDLQRDYNRILQSKKVIQKSFREERERSITSKSEIAVAKKQKWLQLERQKNEIQIIYKEREQQIKTAYEISLGELRAQLDKVKREKQLLSQQMSIAKQQLKNNQNQPVKIQSEKQNIYSDYHKKLASVDLEIALTENIYQTLINAKSKVRRIEENDKKQGVEPLEGVRSNEEKDATKKGSQPQTEEKEKEKKKPLELKKLKESKKGKQQEKLSNFQYYMKKAEERDYKQFKKGIDELEKLSEAQSKQMKDVRQFLKSEEPGESGDDGSNSPTFNLLHSFNKKYF